MVNKENKFLIIPMSDVAEYILKNKEYLKIIKSIDKKVYKNGVVVNSDNIKKIINKLKREFKKQK